MIIKSKIQQKFISLKGVLTKNGTKRKETSETFFKISPQPKNTCPLIDSTIDQTHSLCRQYEDIVKLCEQFSYASSEDLDCCDCQVAIRDNLKDIKHISSNAEDNVSDLASFIDKLERLRTNCEGMREYGTQVKDLFWDFVSDLRIAEDFEIEGLVETHKNNWNSISKPDQDFHSYSFDHDYSKLKSVRVSGYFPYCSEYCQNYKTNAQLEEIFDEVLKINNDDCEVTKATENFEKIVAWVEEVDEVFHKYVSDPSLIPTDFALTEEIKTDFLNLYNQAQKELFVGFILNQSKNPPKEFDSSEYLSELSKSDENLIHYKQAEKFLNSLNSFISTYNQRIIQISIDLMTRSKESNSAEIAKYAVDNNISYENSCIELLEMISDLENMRPKLPSKRDSSMMKKDYNKESEALLTQLKGTITRHADTSFHVKTKAEILSDMKR